MTRAQLVRKLQREQENMARLQAELAQLNQALREEKSRNDWHHSLLGMPEVMWGLWGVCAYMTRCSAGNGRVSSGALREERSRDNWHHSLLGMLGSVSSWVLTQTHTSSLMLGVCKDVSHLVTFP